MGDPYYIFYQSAMALSLAASVVVIALTWQHRKTNGSLAMIALVVATFVWTLGFLLESHSSTLEGQMLFNNIGYLGSLSVPVALLVFSVNYTSESKYFFGWRNVLLSIPPAIFTILIWTNPYHHLIWYDTFLTTSGPFTITSKTYGVIFWIMFTWNYSLVLTAAGFLVRRLFVGAPLYTRQAVSLIVAVCLPLLWNIIYVFNLVPIPRKDLTPVMFTFSGLILVYGFMRLRLFVAVPFARKFVIKQMLEGILAFDSHNQLIEANPAALKILGLTHDVIGSEAGLLPDNTGILNILISNGFTGTEVTFSVAGAEKTYDIEVAPMNTESSTKVGNLVILRDITDRKEMQEQLISQDRLVSIGELTSGVAHEINNPLTVIKGFMELLMRRNLPDDVKADIRIVNGEVDRAARIVSNLLTFARKQPEEKGPVDVNDAIIKTLELREYEQSINNTRTELHLAPGLPKVKGSEQQLRQVFLNLMINAEYFMTAARRQGTLKIYTETAGNSVRILFSDNGPGIPPGDLKRIFNPFFTTKEVGKGTGLGLSICHGIITEHEGKIWAENAPGGGANFIVTLPIYLKEPPASPV